MCYLKEISSYNENDKKPTKRENSQTYPCEIRYLMDSFPVPFRFAIEDGVFISRIHLVMFG